MILTLKDVAKWYGPVIGLVDVSVEIEQGVTGLLGPNGAGKSTFLKLVAGQLRPSTGEVRVLGHDPFRTPAVFRKVGFSPEPDAFYEDMTGLGFVSFLTRLRGFTPSEARRKAQEAVECVGLTEAAHKRIGAYSKGMRQRIKLAQALAHDPEILILDEPLTGLDPVARRRIVELVRELGEQGRTILISSHVLHEVEAMTPRIVLLHQGRVLARGTIGEIRALLDQYPHRIVVRSPDARELAQALLAAPGVVGAQLSEGMVRIDANNPDEVYDLLPGLVLERNLSVHGLEMADASLDAIFEYLVK
ncbi:MAG: ABC transporter ATP-binding protein [Planctomycetota bacterium]|nr:ABC transporter ATP-binding protein [Planctomycetota bacterium]